MFAKIVRDALGAGQGKLALVGRIRLTGPFDSAFQIPNGREVLVDFLSIGDSQFCF